MVPLANAAAERRHRRDPDPGRPQAQPRLAELRRHLARAEQNQALHPRRGEDPEHRTRQEGSSRRRLRRFEIEPADARQTRRWSKLAAEIGAPKADDLYAAIGYGKLTPASVLPQLVRPGRAAREGAAERRPSRSAVKRVLGAARGDQRIKVRGIDDLMVYLARCCNPIRGEKIVGYITRGKGVSVHSATVRTSST